MVKNDDLFAYVLNFLYDALESDGVWVSDELPPDQELDENLPCVVVDLLPGEEYRVGWGGDGFPVQLDSYSFDVEIFARSRGAAIPLANKVRLLLHQLPHNAGSHVTQVVAPPFGTREDLNPRVKVLGTVADVTRHTN